jgi:hypothetical protein
MIPARRALAAVAVPVAVLAFAACSDDDSAGDESTAEGAGSTGSTPVDSSDDDVDAAEGFEFASPSGGYTAAFPSEPASTQQDTTTDEGRTLSVTQHIAVDGRTSYVIAELAIPAGEPYSFEEGRDASLAVINGELVLSDDIEVDGRDGIEFVASIESGGAAGTYVSRLLTDGEAAYQLIVAGPGTLTLDDETVAAFFDSFTFTD